VDDFEYQVHGPLDQSARFVRCRNVGVHAGEAAQAHLVIVASGCFDQTFKAQIPEGIRADLLPDLFDSIIRGDQFVVRRHIDA